MKKIDKIIIGVGGTILAAFVGFVGFVTFNNQAAYGPPPVEEKHEEKSFNKLDEYLGSHKSRVTVEALLRDLIVYNINLDKTEQIAYVGPSQEEIKSYKYDQNFTISVTRYDKDGQVAEITVTEE